ncbi:MAG: hypothetical protein WC294_06020 [Methanoregula sp.]|jgi:hypothetical protein
MFDGWCVGRKDILVFMEKKFNVTTWTTVKAWRRKGMPMHRLWNKRPYIIETEVIKWQMRNK